MLLFFIGFAIGAFSSAITIYIIARKKERTFTQTIENYETQIFVTKEKLTEINQQVEEEKSNLFGIRAEVRSLEVQRNLLSEHLDQLELNAQQSSNLIFENVQNALDKKIEEVQNNYEEKKENYEEEFKEMKEELLSSFSLMVAEKKERLAELREALAELEEKVSSIVAANKRAKEIADKRDFYRVVISKEDLREIQKLKDVVEYLRDPTALNKVIWKVYYENPTSDMIGRVIGAKTICGIYKITNLDNQMCYVGQSRNISQRWVQHIKRALGAETPSRNKLYPAMAAAGVENFSFEVLEECASENLDEREDFYQEFYHAKTFGYSVK